MEGVLEEGGRLRSEVAKLKVFNSELQEARKTIVRLTNRIIIIIIIVFFILFL